MSLLGFRLQQSRGATSEATASGFIEALTTHNFARASELIGAAITWFGESMAPQAWLKRATAALSGSQMAGTRRNTVEGHVLAAMDSDLAAKVFDGVVTDQHTLQIFEMRRDTETVSLGVVTVTCGETTVVERVLDLRAFKETFSSSAGS